MAKIAMFHEISEDILNCDLSVFDIFTFDDGLYTQYKYHKELSKYKKPMIFFITSKFICGDILLQSPDFITCVEAHKKARNGDYENYMTLDQIRLLSQLYEVGAHSHEHLMFTNSVKNYPKIKEEVDKCLNYFKENNINIKKYCIPYNQTNKLYYAYIKQKNLEIFGNERICVENYFGLKTAWEKKLKPL